MTTEAIASARGILQTADRWLEQTERQLEHVQAEIDAANTKLGELVAEKAAYEKHLADADAAHAGRMQLREKELKHREQAVEIERAEMAAERRKIAEREATVERRSADLSRRLHGIGAA